MAASRSQWSPELGRRGLRRPARLQAVEIVFGAGLQSARPNIGEEVVQDGVRRVPCPPSSLTSVVSGGSHTAGLGEGLSPPLPGSRTPELLGNTLIQARKLGLVNVLVNSEAR